MSIIQSFVIPTRYRRKETDSEFYLYRGDLEHPSAPGNKWHKLKYHLLEAEKRQARYLATFGGPFSNHLHAVAQTLKDSSLQSIAVVRGELQARLTPTLREAVQHGMELWPSSRQDYKLGLDASVVSQINDLYREVYWVPEGGGGVLGAQGCLKWAKHIADIEASHLNAQCDAWVVSSGTGTTSAGMLAYKNEVDLHVVCALKGAEQQKQDILALAYELLAISIAQGSEDVDLAKSLNDYLFFHDGAHEGGFAKQSEALLEFIQESREANPHLMLDPIYTCKSLFHMMQQYRDGLWPYKRTLFIHTGGIQGWRGYTNTRLISR